MAVKDTIQSIKNNVANAYTKLQGKGATIPEKKNIENLASTIDSITSGGETPTGTLLVQQNGVYDVVDYANVDVQVSTPSTPVEPPVLTIKNITENGTYYASDDGADGYSSVTVNVAGSASGDNLPAFMNNTLTEINLPNVSNLRPYQFYRRTSVKKINLTTTNLNYTVATNKYTDIFEGGAYIFYGMRNVSEGTVNINIASGYTGSMPFSNMFAYFGASNGVDVNLKLNSSGTASMSNAFEEANLNKVTFLSGNLGSASKLFTSANINMVDFGDMTTLPTSSNSTNAIISKATIKRIYAKSLTTVDKYQFYNISSKLYLGENCSLAGTGTTYVSTYIKFFIPHNAIDNYSQATNWTTVFLNAGAEETQMFIYGDFASGDTLPTQIGTTQVYNVTWYEDDDFTTLASGTATSDKEYYGKISAVV